MKLLSSLVIAIVPAIGSAFAPTPSLMLSTARTEVKLDMATRRDAIVELTSGFAMTTAVMAGVAQPAMADVVGLRPLSGTPQDDEVVKEQRTVTDKLDINNAPVADYMQVSAASL